MGRFQLDELYDSYLRMHGGWLQTKQHPEAQAEFARLRQDWWERYVAEGGVRPPAAGHDVQDPEFEELVEGMQGAVVEELQELLGMSKPARSGEFDWVTRERVKDWQEVHGLPVTGRVDAVTWVGLIGPGDPGEAAEFAESYHVATRVEGDAQSSAVPRIRPRAEHHWMLALDNVPYRTFANSFNLGLLARLVYSEEQTRKLRDLLNRKVRYSRLGGAGPWIVEQDEGEPMLSWRPIVRRAREGHEYRRVPISRNEVSSDPGNRSRDISFIDTQIELWAGSDHAIVLCRGTEGKPPDAITDASAWNVRWPYGPGEAAWGFYNAFECIREEFDKELGLLPGPVPLFIVGHSLGGAIATLIACYVRSTYRELPVQLYTYAQPRVADAVMAQHYASDPKLVYYRFENPFDPVPMVPSRRSSHDLVSFLGSFPDAAFWALDKSAAVVQKSSEFMTAFARILIDDAQVGAETAAKVANARETVEKYRRFVEELRFDQCRGQPLSFAELAPLLAPPNFDARHFGTLCRLVRRGGRPAIHQLATRQGRIEASAEVDKDDLNQLLWQTLKPFAEIVEAAAAIELPAVGIPFAVWLERQAGEYERGDILDGEVKVRINLSAHSMGSYLAYLLYEFRALRRFYTTQKEEDAPMPFAAAPVDSNEAAVFTHHYFSTFRFWGDRAEDLPVTAKDNTLYLW